MTDRTPRRDFLLSRLAAMGDAAEEVNSSRLASLPDREPYIIHLSRKAMAGEFEICLPVSIAGESTAAALESLDMIQSLERQLSFFKPESDISEINRLAAETAVEIEPRLFSLLQTAMQLWRDSDGAYDLTAAPLWEAWGFARRAGAIPSPEQLAVARELVGGQWIELDESQQTIRFHRRGVRLNLGSIGKGYAVDRAVEIMQAAGVADFLVHGGYSSVAARGLAEPAAASNRTGEGDVSQPVGMPWKIGVKDPQLDQRRLGQVELQNRALGTSGAQFQSFRYQGRRYGHILDPRSGQPVDGVLSVTVLAPSAAEADALSTAFYVMGPDSALSYCRRRPELAAMIFTAEPGNRWKLHHAGLAAESAELLAALESR